jgi:hypothetical protein
MNGGVHALIFPTVEKEFLRLDCSIIYPGSGCFSEQDDQGDQDDQV